MIHILVVDDEPFILEVLQRMFRSMGFDVHTADSWEQGAEVYSSSQFDLVMLDIVMPGVSGFEAAQEIKRRNPEQRVVLITGLGPEITEDNARERGVEVDDYLFKPFTYKGVKAMMDNLLLSEASVSV
jgi:DNA-binding response OmpR family regulator